MTAEQKLKVLLTIMLQRRVKMSLEVDENFDTEKFSQVLEIDKILELYDDVTDSRQAIKVSVETINAKREKFFANQNNG